MRLIATIRLMRKACLSAGFKALLIIRRHEGGMNAHAPRHALPQQALAIVALAAFGLVAALMGGPASGQVAVVFPPWWDGTRTVNAAAKGGLVLRFGPWPFVVLVAPDELHGREQLWRSGAWLLLNPQSLRGCGLNFGVNSVGDPDATRR